MIAHLLGRILRGVHAGQERLAWNHNILTGIPETIEMHSDSFAAGAEIPLRYAGKGVGQNMSPSLSWTGISAATVELVLVMEDPDAPLRRPFVHMIAYGLDSTLSELPEGALAGEPVSSCPVKVFYGRNTFGHCGYQGPRPLPSHGPHHYVFQIFALKRRLLPFPKAPALQDLMAAMAGTVIARGRLEGFLERQ